MPRKGSKRTHFWWRYFVARVTKENVREEMGLAQGERGLECGRTAYSLSILRKGRKDHHQLHAPLSA